MATYEIALELGNALRQYKGFDLVAHEAALRFCMDRNQNAFWEDVESLAVQDVQIAIGATEGFTEVMDSERDRLDHFLNQVPEPGSELDRAVMELARRRHVLASIMTLLRKRRWCWNGVAPSARELVLVEGVQQLDHMLSDLNWTLTRAPSLHTSDYVRCGLLDTGPESVIWDQWRHHNPD